MYLVSELVRELTDYKELTNYFGFDIFGDLYNMTEDFISQKDKQNSYAKISKNKLAMQLLDMLRSGTDSSDIVKLNHWGKTTDGRYVLLDYGASKDIIKKYYQKNNIGISNGSYEWF